MPGKGCKVTLAVPAVSVTPGCWIDEKVGQRSAVLVFACAGGPAEADFGVPFKGTVTDGQVDIAATTTFPWGDGCTWESHQRIGGSLASGELSYAYDEAPIAGKGCQPAHCKGSAPVAAR